MARHSTYTLDGKTVSLREVASEFTAYGRHCIRDGLAAGHTTRETLLAYLAAREVKHTTNLARRPVNLASRVYFARRTGEG